MTDHEYVIDLETLGTGPGCVICTLGAVEIDRDRLEVVNNRFYTRIDILSCLDAGLTVDPDTVIWWLRNPSVALINETLTVAPRLSLRDALTEFAAYLKAAGGDIVVYGNGPSFDLSILRAAYEAVGIPLPWRYPNERCVRTFLANIPRHGGHTVKVENTNPHHALYDAITEADEMMQSERTLFPTVLPVNEEVESVITSEQSSADPATDSQL